MRQFNVEEFAQIHQALIENEVVEGPPELKELVEEFWPELLHKIKPPIEEMH